jgi:ubiquinone/menaquinone biosynthesis C-methylase UbiE
MKTADIGCGTGYNTMGLARLVGRGGGVLAVDVQQGALAKVEKRAARQGLESVVSIMHVDAVEHRELPSIDFALAFWMVHEVPDCRAFFRWVFEALVPGGRLLVAEPPMHITQKVLQEEVSAAGKAGFQLVGSPRIRFCMTMLFEKPE